MSLANYTDLTARMAEWLHRDDLTAKIPDFIRQAEAMFKRRIKTVPDQVSSRASLSTTTRYLALPSNFNEIVSLRMVVTYYSLEYVPPNQMKNFYLSTDTDVNRPQFYTIRDQIEFNCIADQAYQVEMQYIADGAYDLATNTTNWLMTNHPDLYLYASLMPAQIYMINDPRFALFKTEVEQKIIEVNREEARKMANNIATLRMDEMPGVIRRTNIEVG